MHELYILRHGQTVWNAEGRMQGWGDSPLTPEGEMQAARQYEILRSRDLSAFDGYCSPSGRAIQTAAIAVAPLLGTVRTDDRLREIGVGDWQGKLRRDLPGTGDGVDLLLAHYENAPGGEGLERLRDRARAFLDGLVAPAVIVTHGITSRMIRSLLIGPEVLDLSTPHGGQGVVWHVKDGVQTLLR